MSSNFARIDPESVPPSYCPFCGEELFDTESESGVWLDFHDEGDEHVVATVLGALTIYCHKDEVERR